MKNISEDLELAENAYSEEGADYADSTCQHGDPYDSKPKPESGEVSEIRFGLTRICQRTPGPISITSMQCCVQSWFRHIRFVADEIRRHHHGFVARPLGFVGLFTERPMTALALFCMASFGS